MHDAMHDVMHDAMHDVTYDVMHHVRHYVMHYGASSAALKMKCAPGAARMPPLSIARPAKISRDT